MTVSACLWLGWFPLLQFGSFHTITYDKWICMLVLTWLTLAGFLADAVMRRLSRPRLLPLDTELTMRATAEDGKVYVTVDGEQSFPLTPTDWVTVRRAQGNARLIRLNTATFYDVLQEKLAGRR